MIRPPTVIAGHICGVQVDHRSAAASRSPKVSIHIITYNQQDFIAEAIEGAVSQNYDNLEVVVSDDASNDATPAIVADYAARYPGRIIAILNRTNGGITRNSNVALRACTGDLIAFTGGDDILLPGKIRAQVDWFGDSPDRVLCGHQAEVFYDDGSRKAHPLTRRLVSGHGPSEFIRHESFGALTTMIRASRVPSWGFDERLPNVSDLTLWVDVLAAGGEYGHVPGTFARHRRHDANVTNQPLKMAEEYEQHIRIISERYPQFARDCRYAYIRHVLYYSGVELMRAGRKQEARRRLLAAIHSDPLFPKPWVRLAQSFL